MEPHFRRALWETIRHSEALRYTSSLEEQFEKFILLPSHRFTLVGPVVVVIDAWSEDGDFREFISLLVTRASELPTNFRIVVVCPADSDYLPSLLQATPAPRLTSLT